LDEHERQESFILDSPPCAAAQTIQHAITEAPGTLIGPYKLLEQIGEGGFGVVFMADQHQPLRRKVALKIIKPGMDTRQVIARFEAERQALAVMDHPGIARVFDAGATASGRPYFVMELVKGVPITEHCDQNQLTPRQRLVLFQDVCQAVQHAHQKGIIHRDLKPSNVLVTVSDGKPLVKVIDFGVAKATGGQLTDKTLFTGFAQMVGTPLYMSPEQAGLSADIDTRSDIYSLGVLLYELLTGSTPFGKERFAEAAYDEIRRIIREEEPPKPSTKLSTSDTLPSIAANRHTEPARLSKEIRGDLDWIVMKALDKDRSRRYETASSLALDVQRYLADEPVLAGPPSVLYRVQKFARRNRAMLSVAAVLVAAVLSAVASLGWMVSDRAERQWQVIEQITEALAATQDGYRRNKLPDAMAALAQAEDLLANYGGNEELRLRARQLRTDLDLVKELDQIRLDRATVVAEGYDGAGADSSYEKAFHNYGIAIDELDVGDAAELIKASVIQQALLAALDDWVLAKGNTNIPERKRLLSLARSVDSDAWRNTFRQAFENGDLKAVANTMGGRDSLDQPPATIRLVGCVLRNSGYVDQAVLLLSQAQKRHPDDFWINHELACALKVCMPPRISEAVGFYRAALAVRPQSAGVYCNLAELFHYERKFDEAIAASELAIELQPDYLSAYVRLGLALQSKQRHDDAIAVYNQAIKRMPDHPVPYNNLGNALANLGKFDEAMAHFQKAIEVQPDYAIAYSNIGRMFARQDNFHDAIKAFNKAIDLNPRYPNVYSNLGRVLEKQGKSNEALAAFHKAIELDPGYSSAYVDVGNYWARMRNWDKAVSAYHQAIKVKPDDEFAYSNLGVTFEKQGKFDEAIEAQQKAILIKPDFARAFGSLGYAFERKGQLDAAVKSYRQANRLDKEKRPLVYFNLANALKSQGKWDEWSEAVKLGVSLLPGAKDEREMTAEALSNQVWSITIRPDSAQYDPARGLELAKKAIEVHPQSVLGWQVLGWAQYRNGNWQASIDALEKSCELQAGGNGDAFQWLFMAMAHSQLGQESDARAWYDKSIQNEKVWPDDLRRIRAEAVRLLGIDESSQTLSVNSAWPIRWEAELAAASEAVRTRGDADAFAARGQLYARNGDFRNATADYVKALQLGSTVYYHWFQGGSVLAFIGDAEGFREHCRRMMERYGETQDRNTAERTAKMMSCVPSEISGLDPRRIVELADVAVASGSPHNDLRWFEVAKGMAQYRAGDFKGATLSIGTAGPSPHAGGALSRLYLAMALYQSGEREQAVKALGEAVEIMESLPKLGRDDLGTDFHDHLFCWLARREAEALILKPSGNSATKQTKE
jgi:tetratricopeptide (TPR) repeat protein/serine/threonine protein kinase